VFMIWYCLLLDGRLCSVSGDGSVKIWNIEAGVCDQTAYISAHLYKVIQLHDGRLLVSDQSRGLAYIVGG
jgi:hypothetical protein